LKHRRKLPKRQMKRRKLLRPPKIQNPNKKQKILLIVNQMRNQNPKTHCRKILQKLNKKLKKIKTMPLQLRMKQMVFLMKL